MKFQVVTCTNCLIKQSITEGRSKLANYMFLIPGEGLRGIRSSLNQKFRFLTNIS